ncbi:MAG: SH3 domain-containing protein [Chloroflexi bacterium]|nr:SH3 domain-containing protein [Chloroflexota bacterium]
MDGRFIRKLAVSCAVAVITLSSIGTPAQAVTPVQSEPNTVTAIPRGYRGTAYVGVRAGARVRACASLGSRIITALPYGTRVYVYYTAGGWSNIGRGRWIANYLLVGHRHPRCRC